MKDDFSHTSPEGSISSRIAATSSLFCTLAWLFSYPSRNQVEDFASVEFLNEVRDLLQAASIDEAMMDESFARLHHEIQNCSRSDIADFRAEYTRLFISPPPPISLLGSRWVKNRSDLSRTKGERYAVREEYRALGLKLRDSVKDPSDHLVSELDYLCYVADAEARAWSENDVASAREWRTVGTTFMTTHLSDLALGVTREINRLSNNALMLFYAHLLETVIKHSEYKQ